MTLDEFLALPDREPAAEFVDGEVVERMAPNWYHAVVATRLLAALSEQLAGSGEGQVMTELRFRARDEGRAYIPDVAVIAKGAAPRDRESRLRGPDTPPAMAIEILSPGESATYVLEKVEFYLRIGVRLVWLIDPELETLTAYRADGSWAVHHADATVDASPVLAGFALPLTDLFAGLHEGESED